MSFFDMGGGSADFLSTLERRVSALLEQHGLLKSTDASATAASAGPFALLSELESPEGYDDRPAVEKLIASISAAAKKMKLPQTHNFRLIGCHPDSCTTLILVAGTYQPVPADRAPDLDQLGRWSLSLRTAFHRNTYEGTVLDHESLVKAFTMLTEYLAHIQEAFKLAPIRRPSYADGGFTGVPGPMPLGSEG